MSVVIVGGNERMIRRYKELCREYHCDAKVIIEMNGALRNMGNPDLLVLFTSTVSHKMVNCALSAIKGHNVSVARSHTSSMAALRSILDQHAVCGG